MTDEMTDLSFLRALVPIGEVCICGVRVFQAIPHDGTPQTHFEIAFSDSDTLFQ